MSVLLLDLLLGASLPVLQDISMTLVYNPHLLLTCGEFIGHIVRSIDTTCVDSGFMHSRILSTLQPLLYVGSQRGLRGAHCRNFVVSLAMEAIGDIAASAEVSRTDVWDVEFDSRMQGGVIVHYCSIICLIQSLIPFYRAMVSEGFIPSDTLVDFCSGNSLLPPVIPTYQCQSA